MITRGSTPKQLTNTLSGKTCCGKKGCDCSMKKGCMKTGGKVTKKPATKKAYARGGMVCKKKMGGPIKKKGC